MSDKSTIVTGLVAGVVGVLIGVAASGDRDGERAAERAQRAMDERLSSLEEGMASLNTRGDRILEGVEPLGEDMPRMEEIRSEISQLADQIAGLDQKLGEATADTPFEEIAGRVEKSVAEIGERLDRTAEELGGRIDQTAESLGGRLDEQAESFVARLDRTVDDLGGRIDALGGAEDEAEGNARTGDEGQTGASRTDQDQGAGSGTDRNQADGSGSDQGQGGASGEVQTENEEETGSSEGTEMAAASPPDAPAPGVDPGTTASAQETAPATAMRRATGETGLELGFGESGQVGDTRVTLSRAQGADVVLREAGGDDVVIGIDSGTATLDNGCTLELAGMTGRRAFIAATCPDDGSGSADAGIEDANRVAALTPEASDPIPEADEERIAREMMEAAGENAVALRIGQTGMIGDAGVFMSRLAGEDVVLHVRGVGSVTLGPDAGSAEIGGCSVDLVGIADGVTYFRPDC